MLEVTRWNLGDMGAFSIVGLIASLFESGHSFLLPNALNARNAKSDSLNWRSRKSIGFVKLFESFANRPNVFGSAKSNGQRS
jgi:hypothetical protein